MFKEEQRMAPERDRSKMEGKVAPGVTEGGFVDTDNWVAGGKNGFLSPSS